MGGKDALREAGACQSCPLVWKLNPGPSLGLPKPMSDDALGLSPALVIPSCVALGNSFCF